MGEYLLQFCSLSSMLQQSYIHTEHLTVIKSAFAFKYGGEG